MSNENEQVTIVPSNPETIERIKKAMIECSVAKTHIDSHRDHVKEIIKSLHEDTKIPKRLLGKMATAYHKDSFRQEDDAQRDYEELCTKVFPELTARD
jgi:ribosome maturation protein Sdo1